jgi:phospholipid/cholesterol/gamma-HCH transport system permease protein
MTAVPTTPEAGDTGAARPAKAAPLPKPAPVRSVEGVGQFLAFIWQAIREIPLAIRLYPAEIVRHASILAIQNAAVILFMLFMLGGVLGLTAHFLFSSIGIDSFIAAVASIGGLRGIMQVVFGWIVAAKVGCGIVAEIGAMRISDEIDALEVMGIRSVPYLASTRIVAAMLVLPLLFVTGMAVNFGAAYLFNVGLLDTVSPGGFTYFLFLFQNLRDFTLAIVWATTLGMIIVAVACYFGYTAGGGPVGVGRNTAQSMLVNLVLVSLLGMVLIQLFYGNNPNAPIGN